MTYSNFVSPGVSLQGGGGTASLPISGNGATITTSTPLIDGTQTWNSGATTFTSLLLNVTDTASAAGSLLMDLRVGGSSAFNVSKGGSLKLGRNASGTNVAASNVVIAGSQGTGTGAGGSIVFQVAPAGSSGTAQNALATAWSISGAGHILAGADNTYDIGASTGGRPRNVYVAGSVRFPSGDGIVQTRYINNTSDGFTAFEFPAGGSGTITYALATTAPLFRFCGTTSSFPALKRDSASLIVRLADDSADAGLQCAALTVTGNLTISTKNIVTDTTTGTKIGTATTQKIGFFNAAPVVQPTAVADATDAATVITQLNALLSRMRDLGLIAT